MITQKNRDTFVSVAVLFTIVACVFGQSIFFNFVDWDDKGYLLNNPLIPHPLSRGWNTFLLTPHMGYPQPLTVLSQHLDFLIGRGAPWPFHLTNVLLHFLNTLLVFAVSQHYLQQSHDERRRYFKLSFLIAAVFASHPIVAEPVSWITGRKDLLAALFILSGYAWYLKCRTTDKPIQLALGLTIAHCCAIAAKPSGIILMPLIFIDILILRRHIPRSLLILLCANSLVAFGALKLASWTQQQHGALAPQKSFAHTVAYVAQHTTLQLKNYAYPLDLTPKYLEQFPQSWHTPWGIAATLTMLALVITIALLIKHRRQLALLCVTSAAAAFAPSSGLIPLNRGPADTYLYLSSFPIAALALITIQHATQKLHHAKALLATIAFTVLAFVTFTQTKIWRSSSTLWESVADKYPTSKMAMWAYADALANEGKTRAAIRVYEQSLSRFPYPPPDSKILTTLGDGCTLTGDYPCAVKWYTEALRHFGPNPITEKKLHHVSKLVRDPRK